uniref:Uncharacterized protein n=1 Tax=Anopheles farauti TaxID=69004 RepID=A0A182QVB8_9DIPT
MSQAVNFRRAHISRVYAISLTSDQKRQLMQRIYNEIHRRTTLLSDKEVCDLCQQLNQCFEVNLASILNAMEIILQLLTSRVATDEVVQSYRKLLSYVSNVLEKDNCGKLAYYLRKISLIALENGTISPERFPIAVMKCILVLMYRLPITDCSDRKIIMLALRANLEWCKHNENLYTQCGISQLLRSAISSTKQLRDDITVAAEMTVLAHHILDVFYSPQPTVIHPIEVLLSLAYEHIFERLVTEWSTVTCFEMLLYVLYSVLKRDITTHLKLSIVRLVADAVGGGMRRFVRLLCVAKHLRDEVLLHKVKTILTIVLALSLFRYEPVQHAHHFQAFIKTIEQMLSDVDLLELANAKFLCFNVPDAKLTIHHVCFVLVIRQLDLLQGVTSGSMELDYVYNLIASIHIIYYKRWKVPSFLVKHLIDGLSRFSNSEMFVKNVPEPDIKMQAILSTTPTTLGTQKAVENMFGRLPATINRIQWLQLQPHGFKATLIFHQQIEMLQEQPILSCEDDRTAVLIAVLSTETLVKVLSLKQTSEMARFNASVLLSKSSLPVTLLRKVLKQIAFACQLEQRASGRWMYWYSSFIGCSLVLPCPEPGSEVCDVPSPLSGLAELLLSARRERKTRLTDSFSWSSTVRGSPSIEFASYTPFIFINPSLAACSWATFCCSSCTLAISFFRRCVGGRSLKSSFRPSVERLF